MAPARNLKLDEPALPLTTCLVADSPHSGTEYPADFGYACDLKALRQAEDMGVDALYDFLPALGVPFLQARFPRAYVDPNRADGVTEKFEKEGDQPYTPAESGLVRARCTPRSKEEVYDRKLSLKEVFNRVASCHKPYHEELRRVLERTHDTFGKVVHLNCHSMPSTVRRGKEVNKYDVLLGTRDGATAAPELVEKLRSLFEAKGYTVGVDVEGYRGAEIIRRAGAPSKDRHSIQVELNRGLYMDEETLEFTPGKEKLRQDLREIVTGFAAFCDAFPASAPAVPPPQRENVSPPPPG